ncbi:WD40 repeat-like protein [Jaminaea rosea]|uniref:WD40 repeat-like protein n=1 Tax=Jaminaea rosea TaxID=1569628 RepID=A0A316UJ83_9BASI|nr:WD40 repeat-like protein [Jaminaea rosea]PWN24928.1 WD40 repeat-like protein [Jaminaea rosea]
MPPSSSVVDDGGGGGGGPSSSSSHSPPAQAPRLRTYFPPLATPSTSSLAQRRQHLSSAAPRATASTSLQRSIHLDEPAIRRLDLAAELGDAKAGYGHEGCVNAMNWSQDGRKLATGSDDCCVLLWEVGTSHIHPPASKPTVAKRRPYIGAPAAMSSHSSHDDDDDSFAFPSLDLGLFTRIHTGHRGNIFDVAFAPHTSDRRLISVAGDAQVRVFDLERGTGGKREKVKLSNGEIRWIDDFHAATGGVECRTLKCHRGFVKRVQTEQSADIFLTVSEDGDVRQHDLRTHHICRPRYGSTDSSTHGSCPRPLIHHSAPLYTLSLSPLQPWLFAVAGMSPYAYLYDRRMAGRVLEDEWGAAASTSSSSSTTDPLLARCVRRFGLPCGDWDGKDCRPQQLEEPGGANVRRGRRRHDTMEHITAVQLGETEERCNELLASYSGGAVYRFNIRDGTGVLQHREGEETGKAKNYTDSKRGVKRSSSASAGDEAWETTSASASGSTSSSFRRSRKQSRPSTAERDAHQQDETDKEQGASDPNEGTTPRPSVTTAHEEARAREREAGLDPGNNAEETLSSSSGSSSPTEQEAAGFPLYQQLIADGLAGELDGGASEDGGEDDDDEDEEEDESDWPPAAPVIYDLDDEEDDEDEDEDEDEDVDEDLDLESDEEFYLDRAHPEDEEEDEDAALYSDEDEDDDGEGFPFPSLFGFRPPRGAEEIRQDRLSDAQIANVPIVYPKQRYRGHINVETVKDVAFLYGTGSGGERKDFVCSGSDDGHFFIWSRETAELVGLWQGDGSVVNVVRQHPLLPVLVVSGIDDSVKVFAPKTSELAPGEKERTDGEEGDNSDGVTIGRSRNRWDLRDTIMAVNNQRLQRGMNGYDDDEDSDDFSEEDEDDEGEGHSGASGRQTLRIRDLQDFLPIGMVPPERGGSTNDEIAQAMMPLGAVAPERGGPTDDEIAAAMMPVGMVPPEQGGPTDDDLAAAFLGIDPAQRGGRRGSSRRGGQGGAGETGCAIM